MDAFEWLLSFLFPYSHTIHRPSGLGDDMRTSALLAASTAACASCTSKTFSNLVTFGDSYTDDGRLAYYISSNGSAPPAGTIQPQTNVTASGGLAWGQYVQEYAGVAYFDYAVSGATCSNEIISRYFSTLDEPFPSVVDDQLPSFVADVASEALYTNRTAENTVYALWIGTNDLGVNAFFMDSQAPGVSCPQLPNRPISGEPRTDRV